MITITPDQGVEAFSTKGVEIDSFAFLAIGHSSSPQIKVITIPESFWKGLSDCDSGRVVDMDRAMNDTPPNAD